MSVIGIDPSLAATGIAYNHRDGGWETITVPTKPGAPDRLALIYDAVRLAIFKHDPTLAVIEDLPTHAKAAGMTGMAQGVVRLGVFHEGVPYVTVPPASLKTYATGKGNATKADMRMALYQRCDVDLRDDNQVDATWLRLLGLHLLGAPEVELPKTHLRALDKVTLPAEVAA